MTALNRLCLAALGALALSLGFAGSAAAFFEGQPCDSDEECGPRYVCMDDPATCAGEEPCAPRICMRREFPQPEPGCTDNTACDEGEYCHTYLGECLPDFVEACADDANCGDGFECVNVDELGGDETAGFSWEQGPTDGSETGWATESDGTETEGHMPKNGSEPSSPLWMGVCIPTWILIDGQHCMETSECAAGFECVHFEYCDCGPGSTGDQSEPWTTEPPSGSDGEETEPIAPPGTESGSGSGDFKNTDDCCFFDEIGFCEPVMAGCAVATDCDAGWTCEVAPDDPSDVPPTTDVPPPPTETEVPEPTEPTEDWGTSEPGFMPITLDGTCTPPGAADRRVYDALLGRTGGPGFPDPGTDPGGTAASGDLSEGSDAASGPEFTAGDSSAGETDMPATGEPTGPGSDPIAPGSDPTAPGSDPTAPGSDPSAPGSDATSGGNGGGGGGCSAAPGSPAGGSALAFLALLGLVLRRRD
ncbi:MAG: hypothetical protein EA398_04760 [Deltaproteobacteria bacterium]|nr:MAG: hypothetical protein EA398_04760 [Deltaproteobacteria bacterium]